MKKGLIIIFVVFSLTGLSQSFQHYFPDTLQKTNIAFQGNFFYGSDGMSNQFMNKFIVGGKIQDGEKQKAYKQLKPNNTFGADLNTSIQAEIPFDTLFGKTSLSLVVGVEMVEHVDVNFTEDLFKLTFEGNKQFAGEFAELGGVGFNYFSYQQLNIGFINYKKQHGKIAKEGIQFSILQAKEHMAIKIPRGTLFTEELGKEIELDVDYIYNSSDTANRSFFAFNGYGVSTDLFSEFYLKNNDKITVQVNDLGFIQWNQQSIQLEADSIFNYDGVDIDNIFDLNDSIVSSISRDSLIELISSKKNKQAYAIALPTSFNVFYTKQLNSKIKMNLGVQHKILANYFPMIYGNMYYYFNPTFTVQTHFSFGGYGLFNTGLAVAKSFNHKIQFYLGSNNVLAFILPKATYSGSGFVGLKMYF